ncbi:hypothetical protein VTL71DRAFT_13416 [Oculimacula yallundae]|uniref:Uncharacterized protein n=1 Tax=Oculimacula yallundae TaxID=86028 RepID=A0ABR4CKS9_9HELO
MFSRARKTAQVRLKQPYDDNEILQLSLQSLPQSYTLAQLHDELIGDDGKQNVKDDLPNLLILYSCLHEPFRLDGEDDAEEYLTKLLLWISFAILPTAEIANHDESPEDSTNAPRQNALHAARQKGNLGLQIILKLLTLPEISKSSSIPIGKEVLISILAFTSARDIWSTSTSLATTQQILALPLIQSGLEAPDFISIDILQQFIRPLFSASKPRTVTAAGRKAMPSTAPLKRYDFDDEKASRPWLYKTVYALAVLEWAVGAISSSTLQTSWPLILPPLLTLLDTPGTPILTRGLSLITTLLPKLPPKALAQSGLASVFSDAIIPTTLYLPSITPLSESLQILPLAYEALFTLHDVQFTSPTSIPSPTPSTTTTSVQAQKPGLIEQLRKQERSRITYLTALLRNSILTTYLHASQHPPIVTLLLSQLTTLIPRLGIHAVKFLKDIFPILASVLTDPFAGARLQDVTVALETFRVLCTVCWARIGEVGWRREGVRCLVCIWGVVGDIDGNGNGVDGEVLRRVKEEIQTTGRLFAKGVEGMVDLRVELEPLVDVNSGISDLFGF